MSDPQITPGDIAGWPILKLVYRSDAERIAALLPPGIEPGEEPQAYVSIYNVPVPDEPEYGVKISVAARYRGIAGNYALGYGIDQESAVFISRDMNGQPKYPASVDYYRMGERVSARATHQGYTFLEFEGRSPGAPAAVPAHEENEFWVKVSRAVGGAEKSYDFPPHVVRVHTGYGECLEQEVRGELRLLDSPWDPAAELLPLRELVSARFSWPTFTGRDITLEQPLDPDAYWPFVDTIGGSRWPGRMGGPKRQR